MGFSGYFLIVADFINWAKSNAVPVGPGRGSGAGSLVAYSLGITDLDPLRYDLLFERFLNPERVSMPDFDIDFCQDGRDRVIEYVKKKYGAQSVSQIATFGTMAAKAVVRDVGRVMEWNYGRTDELAKMIPFAPGKLITLAMAREMEPRLAEREQSDEETRELLALAGQLEGLTRNVGMHAGGVLIAPGKLTDFCPLYTAQGAESVVSQFDMKDVEAVGLVKFDFLGLTTLTILDWSMRHIRARQYGEPRPEFSLEAIPLDDPAIYKIFAGANTTAVFQFESRGMRDLLKQARPDRFEDIIALVALYRPGPMDLIPDFIERKQGKQRVEYLDPRLQAILGPTYGIMVYQEQVMQIAQVIGGYSLGSADLLRRAMGKKNAEEMAQQRDIFVAGAAKNGVGREEGERTVRPDGEIRRLRFQQVACRGLRAGRLPDRLSESALSRGIHGGELVGGDGRYRQGAQHLRRRARQRPQGAAARRQQRRLPFRAGGRAKHPLRPGRDQGHGRIGDRRHRARARGGRAVSRPVRFLRAHRQARGQPPRRRGAGARRRVRLHQSRPCQPVRLGRHRARGGGAARAQRAAGQPVRRCRRRRGRASGAESRRVLGRGARAEGGKGEPGLLSLRPPLQRLPRGGAAFRARDAQGSAARRKRRATSKKASSSPAWSNRCASRERRAGAWSF